MPELKTLYVSRKLLNAADVLAWARAQGFKTPLLADDMHVTLAFSRKPVDWSAAGTGNLSVIARGGARSVEPLGDQGAVVLRFECADLSKRWQEFRDVGASWDWPGYKPHVTITYDAKDVDLKKVEPYQGPLEFGPEVFAEVDEDWAAKVKHKTAADQAMALLENPPEPLHAGIRDVLQALAMDGGIDARPGTIAFDRESVRSYSKDGHLHIEVANISKATVNGYRGREIPNSEDLGLDPDKIYYLLRDPDELKKSAASFNGKPLLKRHVVVSADDHPDEEVIGTTGTHAEFDSPYLKNSLTVWKNSGGIADIESDEKKELSCAYHYRADMTPGTFQGVKYDGVMRDIVANHVAIVKAGRAGSDVVVGDSKEGISMSKTVKLTPKARIVLGALVGFLKPKLAEDAALDLSKIAPALDGLTSKNFSDKKRRKALVDGINALVKGKLAKDEATGQDADIGDVVELLDTLKSVEPTEIVEAAAASGELPLTDNDDDTPARDAASLERVRAYLKDKGVSDDVLEGLAALFAEEPAADAEETDEEKAAREKLEKAAKDAKAKTGKDAAVTQPNAATPALKPEVTKKAMDAAIATATKETEERVRKSMAAQRDAETAVKPYIGELVLACDSAEDVYRATFEHLGVDVDGVDPSAFPAILKAQPKPGVRQLEERPAMDSAGAKGFNDRFPGAQAIRLQ